jgi:hypothetical protein
VAVSSEEPHAGSVGYVTADFKKVDESGTLAITDPPVTQQQPGKAPASVGDGRILEINTPDPAASPSLARLAHWSSISRVLLPAP